MLELHVKNTTVESSTVAISWCADPATLKAVSETGQEAHLLLVVRAEQNPFAARSSETRRLVPLKDTMAFISFQKAGRNRVFGCIITGTKAAVSERLLRRDGGSWWNDVTSSDGGEMYPLADPSRMASIDVEVPKECFAPEPPAWEKAWVNRLFSDHPTDQCGYRRRRLIAYTLQPLLWLFCWALWIMLIAVAMLLGLRAISFMVLIDPWYMDPDDFLKATDGTYFWPKVKKWDNTDSIVGAIRFLFVGYMPLIPLGIWLVCRAYSVSPTTSLILALGLPLAGGAAILLLVLLMIGLSAVTGTKTKRVTAPKPELIIAEDDLDTLVCGNGPRFSIGDLPRERRTIRLRYEAMKAAICRPFSR